MTVSGWEELSGDWESPNIDLRLRKDGRSLHIFQIRRREPFSGEFVVVRSSDEKPMHLFGVADVTSFSDDELSAALDGLLTGPASLERVMLFERMFDKEQKERWLEILEGQPPRDVFAQIRLGEMYQQKGQTEKAMQALTRAATLVWAVQDDNAHKNRLKSLAKQSGDEKLAERVPTRQDFLDAGFVELNLDAEPLEIETDLNVPATMFFDDPNDGPQTFVVTVFPTGNESDPFSVTRFQRVRHGSSWGSRGGGPPRPDGRWYCSLSHGFEDIAVTCQITQIDQQERFVISTTVDRQPHVPKHP
jgi:hypothetical protein